MASVILDTHTLLWHLFDPVRLSKNADNAIQSAISKTGASIHVSAISVVEIVYLVDKGKLPPSHLTNTITAIRDPATAFQMLDVNASIGINLTKIPRSIVPDMPDRIVATTGLVYALPVVTRDHQIQKAPITTIW